MQSISKDIIRLIFGFLDSKDLINASFVCFNWKTAFHLHIKQTKINLSGTKINDNGLSHLKGVKDIDLSGCEYISDNGLLHLKGVKNIDLSFTEISDSGIGHLRGVEVIYLYATKKIKGYFLSYFSGVKQICVSRISRIYYGHWDTFKKNNPQCKILKF